MKRRIAFALDPFFVLTLCLAPLLFGNASTVFGDTTVTQPSADTANAKHLLIEMPVPFGVHLKDGVLWATSVKTQLVYQIRNRQSKRPSIVKVAGSGQLGSDADAVEPGQARMNWPHEVWPGDDGIFWIADTRNHRIAEVSGDPKRFRTLAGGEPAVFNQPHSVIQLDEQTLLVADTKNHRLCSVRLSDGRVSNFGGDGRRKMPKSGQRVDQTSLFGPRALAADDQSIWLALREGNSIWKIDRETRIISRIAGTGKKGYSGDGGDPLEATFSGPKGLAVDGRGRLLVVDTENHCVRRIDLQANRIETVLGGTTANQNMPLKRPHGITAEPTGEGFWVADSEQDRIIGWLLNEKFTGPETKDPNEATMGDLRGYLKNFGNATKWRHGERTAGELTGRWVAEGSKTHLLIFDSTVVTNKNSTDGWQREDL